MFKMSSIMLEGNELGQQSECIRRCLHILCCFRWCNLADKSRHILLVDFGTSEMQNV